MNFPCKLISVLALAAICAGVDVSLRPPQLEVKAPAVPAQPSSTPQNLTEPQPKTQTSTTTPAQAAPAAETLGAEISLAQAKKLFDEGTTFLDARLPREYKEEHIRYAQLVDSNELSSPESTAVLSKIPPTQRLVVYCGGGDCHASHQLAIFLQQAGYTDVHVFKDGFPAWKAAGYETTKGENP